MHGKGGNKLPPVAAKVLRRVAFINVAAALVHV